MERGRRAYNCLSTGLIELYAISKRLQCSLLLSKIFCSDDCERIMQIISFSGCSMNRNRLQALGYSCYCYGPRASWSLTSWDRRADAALVWQGNPTYGIFFIGYTVYLTKYVKFTWTWKTLNFTGMLLLCMLLLFKLKPSLPSCNNVALSYITFWYLTGRATIRRTSAVVQNYFDALPCFSNDIQATLSIR